MNFKKIFPKFDKNELIIIILLTTYLSFIPFNWAFHYDTGHYYLPTIKWMHESFVPMGLANLNYLFGYNSSWFTVAAIVETPLFLKQSSIFITNALIMFFYGSACFLTFVKRAKDQKALFSDYYIIFAILPWIIRTRSNMASMSPDLPSMLIALFVIYLLIRGFDSKEYNYFYFFIAIIFSVFAVTIRISAAAILIGSVLAFIYYGIFIKKLFYFQDLGKSIFKSSLFYKNLIIPFFIILLTWIIKGIILSGCIAYPSKIACFKNLQWYINPKSASKYIFSWARGGLHSDPDKYVGNWIWLGPWFNRFMESGDKIIPIILIIGIILIITTIIRKNFLEGKNYSEFFVPLAVSFLGLAFWFFTAPEPRYGYGYLFSFVILIFCSGFYSIKLPKYKNISKLAITFIIIIVYLVKIVPLNVNINKVFTRDWLKVPEVEVKEEVTKQGVKINTPVKGDQTWYMDLPATPWFNSDLKVIFSKDGNYKMFYYSEENK
jgi:hypothetical protein